MQRAPIPDRLEEVFGVIRQRVVSGGGAFIYLIECQGFVKIGIAGNVTARLAQMQTGNPYPLQLLAAFKLVAPNEEEEAIHSLLDAYRVRGEWFKLPEAMINHILAGKHWRRMRNAGKDPEYFI